MLWFPQKGLLVYTGSVTRTMPSFYAAGAGDDAYPDTVDLQPAVPGTSGDYLLLHVKVRDGTLGAGSIDNITALENAGWDLKISRVQHGASVCWLFAKFHSGSETAPTIEWTGGNAAYARIYAYSDVDTTTPIEAIATTTGNNNDTSAPMPSVTTLTANALAVALLGMSNDVTVGDATGETGGDWVETLAEFVSSEGFDSTLQAQHASMASAGTISGGSTTMNKSTSSTVFGISLRGAVS